MKNLFAALLAVATGTTAFAQSNSQTEVKVLQDYNKYQVVTNGFWDNWFFTIGAGGVASFKDHNKQGGFKDVVTPNYGLSIGKWYSPGIGFRAGVKGFEMKGLTQNGAHSTGEIFDASKGLYHSKYNYVHYHTDVLFNLSNIFSGYREDRVYSFIPYFGLGYMVIKDEPSAEEITANIGINNRFRLSEAFSLNLDVRGVAANDRLDGEVGGRKNEGILTAQLGLTYNFKKRGWDKPLPSKETTIVKYDDALANQLRGEVNSLKDINASLRKQLDNRPKPETDTTLLRQNIAAPVLVTFPINSAKVNDESRVNLGFFAKVIKTANPDVIYLITGYADKSTGSDKRNAELSQDRAQAIYDVLTKEYGVNPRQLEIKAMGGVENMFYNDPRLSRAVITVLK